MADLKEKGAKLDLCKIHWHTAENRSFRAVSNIRSNDIVMFIPYDTILTSRKTFEHPLIRQILQLDATKQRSVREQ